MGNITLDCSLGGQEKYVVVEFCRKYLNFRSRYKLILLSIILHPKDLVLPAVIYASIVYLLRFAIFGEVLSSGGVSWTLNPLGHLTV